MVRIFKILHRKEWEEAVENGVFRGSEVDLRDGYIHFSTASQTAETANRHFSGQDDLLIVAFDADLMGEKLRWEASRHGQLFPHLYATLDPSQALMVVDLPWEGAAHRFPEGLAQ
jgi:uncharacterized protein (DUF952 family)